VTSARTRRAGHWGTIAIFALGSLAHFIHDWAGRPWITALVFPVDESIWEHTRLATWPGLLVLAVQRLWLGDDLRRPGLAFATYVLTAPPLVAILYYAYTGAFGVHGLAYDLVVFVLAVLAGQMAALRVGTRGVARASIEAASWTVVALVAIASIVWTWWAPRSATVPRAMSEASRSESCALTSYRVNVHSRRLPWSVFAMG
jgi:hypothetical protein